MAPHVQPVVLPGWLAGGPLVRKSQKAPTMASPSHSRRKKQANWSMLPHDIVCSVFLKLPQSEIMKGPELVCVAWRRVAVHEPTLWRRIKMMDKSGGNIAMVRAAVDRSAGQCVAFWGPLDDDLLLHLVESLPLGLVANMGGVGGPRHQAAASNNEVARPAQGDLGLTAPTRGRAHHHGFSRLLPYKMLHVLTSNVATALCHHASSRRPQFLTPPERVEKKDKAVGHGMEDNTLSWQAAHWQTYNGRRPFEQPNTRHVIGRVKVHGRGGVSSTIRLCVDWCQVSPPQEGATTGTPHDREHQFRPPPPTTSAMAASILWCSTNQDRDLRKPEQMASPSHSRRKKQADWSTLPHDILYSIFLKLRQSEIMKGPELVCAAWRRVTVHEPALWRCPQWTAAPVSVLPSRDLSITTCCFISFEGELEEREMNELVAAPVDKLSSRTDAPSSALAQLRRKLLADERPWVW
ncbi:hypothetical protein HU200_005055 [Digitaria exilis]|uniref:F-box domain-containing protein n=1 Tax=Digitaria exilis TaxID=1010633 RepID=A0A835FRB1_9POAL|nr:hypothetical protein HU200_005055 [Digitaria exilis]